MKIKSTLTLAALAMLALSTLNSQLSTTFAQGTAFSYQGQLQNNNSPASGTYNLQFSLFNVSSGGTAVAGPVTTGGVAVSNGLFTVLIDFGPGVFTGTPNWLQIAVETNGVSTFTMLTPRQPLTPTPQSIYALNAATAAIATTATNWTGSFSGDVSGSQGATVVASVGGQTAANIAEGVMAANSASSSNIPGTIIARDGSGNFSAASATLGGSLYLPFPAIIYAGANPTYIDEGSFFAGGAGNTTLTGVSDVGVGTNALHFVSNGSYNTAIGEQALYSNRTGQNNTGSGYEALMNNTNGNNNIALGYQAGYNITAGFNIDIGNPGLPGEHNTIRIGLQGTQTNTYVAGIYGTGLTNGSLVGVTSSGQLGTLGSLLDNQLPGNGSITINTANGLTGGGAVSLGGSITLQLGTLPSTALSGSYCNASVESLCTGAAIGAGAGNSISGSTGDSFVGGGLGNTVGASSSYSGILGGQNNIIQANAGWSVIAGGENNTTYSGWSTIGGGAGNNVGLGTSESTIGGGWNNTNSGNYATIAGGSQNTAGASAQYSAIGGGQGNSANWDYTTVGGGQQNTISSSADHATIGGGWNNTIGSGAYDSFIGGGVNDTNNGTWSTICGGDHNTIAASVDHAVIGGGGYNTNSGGAATVAGGYQNAATAPDAAVGGGNLNVAGGNYATVPGGYNNHAYGAYSFAGGHQATASYPGSFVWSDSTGAAFDGNPNEFFVNARGGVSLFSGGCDLYMGGDQVTGPTIPGASGSTPNHVVFALTTTAYGNNGPGISFDTNSAEQYSILITSGGGNAGYITWGGQGISWTCDRNVKENFSPVDSRQVLDQLAAIPISTWTYKAQSKNPIRHLGPMAQDFQAAFRLGTDDKHINEIDETGVALAAIQGLNRKVDEKDALIQQQSSKIQNQSEEIAELKARLDRLEQAISDK